MTIENQDVDLNNEEDLNLEDDQEEQEEDQPKEEEKPKEKKQFTPEEQLAIHERKAKQLRKQLGKDSDVPKDAPKEKATKSGDIDYGALAFYNTKSDAVKIESDEDIEFLQDTMKETGKSQGDILASKWFKEELKERAEDRRSAEAVPKGTKRSGQSSRDSVDYWLAKGELPENTPENQELRRKVVDARIKRETSGSNFSSSPSGSVMLQSQLKK